MLFVDEYEKRAALRCAQKFSGPSPGLNLALCVLFSFGAFHKDPSQVPDPALECAWEKIPLC